MTFHACKPDGSTIGEFTESEFQRKIFANEIQPEDFYWREGMPEWTAVRNYRRRPSPPNASGAGNVSAPIAPRDPASAKLSMLPGKERKERTITVDTPVTLGLLGGAILIVGVFAPIMHMPFVGSVNYFMNGKGDGSIVIILGIISISLSVRRQFRWLWLTGAASVACPLYSWFRLVRLLNDFQKDASTDTGIFSGLTTMFAQSFNLEWGFPLLIFGGIVLLFAAAIGSGNLRIRFGAQAK